jgi:hypothetical protein
MTPVFICFLPDSNKVIYKINNIPFSPAEQAGKGRFRMNKIHNNRLLWVLRVYRN